MTSWQLLTFALAAVVFVASPGPGIFATLAKAMSEGAWAVLPMSLGLALGDSVYLVLSAYGLSTLATNFHGVFLVIKYLGAAYLFYLAWSMWRETTQAAQANTLNKDAAAGRKSAKQNFSAGFLISLSNPKVILFYVSLLPTFFPVTSLSALDIAIVCAVLFIIAVAVTMAYALLAEYAQRRLRSSKSKQVFNRAGAALMAGAGSWLLLKG